MKQQVMTRAEVAEFLRVSEPTVTRAVKKYGLPAVQFGRVYRFYRVDVERWKKNREAAE
jgi:excisionase family DNA binding protein